MPIRVPLHALPCPNPPSPKREEKKLGTNQLIPLAVASSTEAKPDPALSGRSLPTNSALFPHRWRISSVLFLAHHPSCPYFSPDPRPEEKPPFAGASVAQAVGIAFLDRVRELPSADICLARDSSFLAVLFLKIWEFWKILAELQNLVLDLRPL